MTLSSSSIRTLCIDQDRQLLRATASYLQSHNVELFPVLKPESAVADIDRLNPDVVLLELSLAGADGFKVCRQIRERYALPVIVVTSRTEVRDRVRAFEVGADDFVPKPFHQEELLARIRAHVRRSRGLLARDTRRQVGELEIDPITRRVSLGGRPIALTSNEVAILSALAQQARRVVSRDVLLRIIHGSLDESMARSIDVIVSRIRAKIEVDPKQPQLLLTVRRAGYVLVVPTDEKQPDSSKPDS